MPDRAARPGAVLVPTGRQMKSYAVIRSLARRGIRTIMASEYDSIPQFASRYCDERARVPPPDVDVVAYKDALLELAARSDVRTVVPVREADTYVLAKYGEAFAEHVSLVSPDLPTLRGAHDRLRLAEVAREAGIPHAETRLVGDVDVVEYPAVVKSRFNLLTGEYVDGYPAETVEERKDIRYLEPGDRVDGAGATAELAHEPIVQAFIPRAAKALYCGIWDHGEPVATYQHREVRGSSWVGGGGVYRVSDHSEAVETVAHDLLGALDWHGLACIEYIQDAETGEWKFLEHNPRMWQSLPAAIAAGADFPYYYWQCATEGPGTVDPSHELGVGCHYLFGEIGHFLSLFSDDSPLLERPSVAYTAWDIVSTCLTQPHFDYVGFDDPAMLAQAVRYAVAGSDASGRQFRTGESQPAISSDGGSSKP